MTHTSGPALRIGQYCRYAQDLAVIPMLNPRFINAFVSFLPSLHAACTAMMLPLTHFFPGFNAEIALLTSISVYGSSFTAFKTGSILAGTDATRLDDDDEADDAFGTEEAVVGRVKAV